MGQRQARERQRQALHYGRARPGRPPGRADAPQVRAYELGGWVDAEGGGAGAGRRDEIGSSGSGGSWVLASLTAPSALHLGRRNEMSSDNENRVKWVVYTLERASALADHAGGDACPQPLRSAGSEACTARRILRRETHRPTHPPPTHPPTLTHTHTHTQTLCLQLTARWRGSSTLWGTHARTRRPSASPCRRSTSYRCERSSLQTLNILQVRAQLRVLGGCHTRSRRLARGP